MAIPLHDYLMNGEKRGPIFSIHVNDTKVFFRRRDSWPQYKQMMDNLSQFCMSAPPPEALPNRNACYEAVWDGNQWFRAILINKWNAEIRVQFVDHVVKIPCSLSNLRLLAMHIFELGMVGEPMSILIEDSNDDLIPYNALLRHPLSNGVFVLDLHDEVKNVNVSLFVFKAAVVEPSPEDAVDVTVTGAATMIDEGAKNAVESKGYVYLAVHRHLSLYH